MKKLTLLALLALSIIACKEKDLTDSNPPLPVENLQVKTSFLYDGEGFTEDSMLVNNLGQRFFITDIKFLATDFYFIHTNTAEDDSVQLDSGFYRISRRPDDIVKRVARIKGGGYSGNYGFKSGIDSIDYVNLPAQTRGDALDDTDLRRNDQQGYNCLVIKGRVIDPKDPMDTIGKIPFEYHIGSYYLSKVYRSDKVNFAVSSTSTASFILNVDPEPIFRKFNIVKTPTVTSDYSDPVDFGIATMMLDSLKVGLF